MSFLSRVRAAARAFRRDSAFFEEFGLQGGVHDPYARMGVRLQQQRLTEAEIFELYRLFSIAANAVDIPAEDMTREGFVFSCPGAPDVEERVRKKLRDLNFDSVLHDVVRYELLTGDGFALIGVRGGGDDLETDLWEIACRGQLEDVLFLHQFHQFNVADIELEDDILSPRYGQNKFIVLKVKVGGEERRVRVHASRVLHLQTRGFAHEKFGRSIYERLLTNLQVLDTMHWSVGQLVYSLFFKVIKSPRFAGMDENTRQKVVSRLMASLNALTVFVMDSDEEMQIVSPSASLGGFDAVSQFLWDMLAASTRVPKHHLLGQRQGVLTGAEWDTRTYYARIKSLQESYLRELIEYFVKLLMMARAVGGLSLRDIETLDWKIEFNQLFIEDEKERAEREFKRAQMHAIYLQYGVVAPDEVRGELDWVKSEETPLERVMPEQPDIVSPGRTPTPPQPQAATPSSGVAAPSAFRP